MNQHVHFLVDFVNLQATNLHPIDIQAREYFGRLIEEGKCHYYGPSMMITADKSLTTQYFELAYIELVDQTTFKEVYDPIVQVQSYKLIPVGVILPEKIVGVLIGIIRQYRSKLKVLFEGYLPE